MHIFRQEFVTILCSQYKQTQRNSSLFVIFHRISLLIYKYQNSPHLGVPYYVVDPSPVGKFVVDHGQDAVAVVYRDIWMVCDVKLMKATSRDFVENVLQDKSNSFVMIS